MIIANWKMQKTYQESISWCQRYKNELINLYDLTRIPIVICPSFVSILSLTNLFKKNSIKIGAQNCASEEKGAFTGEVSVLSLNEIGCDFCIIGHSERRINFNETDELIAKKISLLIKHKITPILCIGETKEEYNERKTFNILQKQISSSLNNLKNKNELIIAYEPIWSIGTGIIPEADYLQYALQCIKKFIAENYENISCKILYGGSVNDKNILDLKKIEEIEGYLLGSASLDFQTLKKIVLLLKRT